MARAPLTGHRIRTARRDRSMTQVALAKAAGISPAYLNLIEHNRRSIGGTVLLRLAEALELPPAELTGSEENRVLSDLDELAGDPLFADSPLLLKDLTTVLGVAPGVASAMVTLYRAYRQAAEQNDQLSERLSHDPFLAHAAHSVVSRITSIRSFAEILRDYGDLETADRERFTGSMAEESERLSEVASEMFSFLNSREAARASASPSDEVDDLLYDQNNFFESLERAADQLRPRILSGDVIYLEDLIRYLEKKHSVAVKRVAPEEIAPLRYRWEPEGKMLYLSKGLPPASSRFEAARLVSRLDATEAVDAQISAARLTTDEAIHKAREALHSYFAGALILPYEEFRAAAEETRHDIELLQQQYAASWEQVCHRLTSLRRPGSEGIPFHLLRTDIAGNISKRFSASGLQMPRYGGACPRWAVHHALLTPEKLVTQLVETQDRANYLFIAKSETKASGGYREPSGVYSIMIGCDAAFAGRMVYADGMDVERARVAVPIGITCRQCSRDDCAQRVHARFDPEQGE
ncbi:short-chain fatty acyl-CoA regulator family protein [Aestuariispira insulae]|uniref:HTH cro/C1-type domain-containing protein n=1 Tax=Aestuariispira insulae TaxID=1461337 RepID=A0A3D9HKT7_9PROT|nr:short-chain fatty acyl-CoA regulator family protein [Aestuariispira insulae]RED49911.1 hypothetical protein DFP90_105284 [Aestuariispira insulae]